MTSPIIIQKPGLGQQISQGLAPLLEAFKLAHQRQVEAQQFALQVRATEAEIAQRNAQTAATQLQLEQTQRAAKGQAEAAKLLQEITESGAEFNMKTISGALAKLKTPEGVAAFMEAVPGMADAFAATTKPAQAEATLAGTQEDVQLKRSAARVAEETETQRIEAETLANELAAAQTQRLLAETEGAQVDTRLAELQETRDPDRVSRATALWQLGGITWGDARQSAGLAAGGIPDDEVFVPPTSGQAGSEAARKAGTFAQLMQTSSAMIDILVEKTGGITSLASLQRQTKFPLADLAINKIISEEQQQLVNAHRNFGDAFRFYVSGQQSSDREALRILNTVAEQAGDSPATHRQKRFMRHIMIQAAWDAARGASSPTQVMDRIIQEAETIGMDKKVIDIFREQRKDAEAYERRIAAGQGPLFDISNIPTEPDTLGTSLEKVDTLFNRQFQPR